MWEGKQLINGILRPPPTPTRGKTSTRQTDTSDPSVVGVRIVERGDETREVTQVKGLCGIPLNTSRYFHCYQGGVSVEKGGYETVHGSAVLDFEQDHRCRPELELSWIHGNTLRLRRRNPETRNRKRHTAGGGERV